jgi:hypothetical protein
VRLGHPLGEDARIAAVLRGQRSPSLLADLAALVGRGRAVDASNRPAVDKAETVAYFGGTTRNLLAAEEQAGVRHHVLLSIVGIHRPEVATGQPQGRYVDVAGPEPQDLVDMARRTLEARGRVVKLVPTWSGSFGPEMAGNVLLPGDGARIAPTTFDDWLAKSA